MQTTALARSLCVPTVLVSFLGLRPANGQDAPAPGSLAGDRASAVLKAMGAAARAINSIEVTAITPDGSTTSVLATRSPQEYWARHQAGETNEVSYASFVGDTYAWQKGSSDRVVEQPSAWGRLECRASLVAHQACWAFFEHDRLMKALQGSPFHVLAEEVEGHMCDVIGAVVSVGRSEFPITKVLYYWVDQETHLPLAYQEHVFRRNAVLLDKLTFMRTTTNSDFRFPEIADVPAQGNQPPAAPPSGSLPAGASALLQLNRGDPCPSLKVQTIELADTTLPALLKGRTVVTFWATWCGYCKLEMEALAELAEVRDGGLRVVAVGVQDTKGNLRAFAKKKGYPFIIGVDPQCELKTSGMCDLLGIQGIPRSYLFDEGGKLIRSWDGFAGKDRLIEHLRAE